MGSKGSLHFTTSNVEAVVKAICTEYGKPDSYLNKDNTHNGCGKPFIAIGERFISIYDGSFAVYGDIYREAKLLSTKVGMPVMGITNANGDMAGLIVTDGNSLVVDALNLDYEWIQDADINALIKAMSLPYDEESVGNLFELDEPDEFISAFHSLMNIPYFIYFDDSFLKYVSLVEELPQICIYRQTMPYQWDDNFEYIK